jgi:uncharacterized protein (DUF302 family)
VTDDRRNSSSCFTRTRAMRCSGLLVIGSVASLACQGEVAASDNGLVTKESHHSVQETIDRFKAGIKANEANGLMFFTEIDHAAAAKKFGLEMLPRTVLVFGNPKNGTPVMQKNATLAIDVPLKALVWQDEQGRVWLSYNSSEYLTNTIYTRHGLAPPASATQALERSLTQLSDYATK